jgi:hypothetical protein
MKNSDYWKKITNYWHLNFLLLIAPTRGWHLCISHIWRLGVSTKNSEPTYWTILFVMPKMYFIYKVQLTLVVSNSVDSNFRLSRIFIEVPNFVVYKYIYKSIICYCTHLTCVIIDYTKPIQILSLINLTDY